MSVHDIEESRVPVSSVTGPIGWVRSCSSGARFGVVGFGWSDFASVR